MQTIAIAGASGVVGSRALQHLLASDRVVRVVAVGRPALDVKHLKLVSRVVDLKNVAAIAAELPAELTTAVCCLGTTMKQAGSKEAFRAVDYDAVVAFAQAALQKGARRFVVVTAVNADARSSVFYSRVKGEVEEALERLGFAHLTLVKPSLIDDQGARSHHRFLERLALPMMRGVFAVVGKHHRNAPITAEVLGKAVATCALEEGGEARRVVDGAALHRAGA